MAKKATDPCRAERASVAKSEARLKELEEQLPEAPASQQKRLREQIEAEKVKLRRLQRQLDACVAAH